MREIKEEENIYLHVLIKFLLILKYGLKMKSILGQTPKNTPQQPCRVETSSGQY